MEHFDVLIVGAGLSGIGAGAHLRMECPDKSFAILEGREAMGGTWDLFRYPGVRSDSDMFTLGYRFRPWNDSKALADGPSILKYIQETSKEYDLDKKIRYGHRVNKAEWNSDEAAWKVTAQVGDETKFLTCNFLYLCTGYYDYDKGYTPDFTGMEDFKGEIVHPQKWTDDLDYADKKIVVIGSGATAVTLVPALATKAEHVTMLQRSPTYIISVPAKDRIANFLRKILPDRAAYVISRWKNVMLQMFSYNLSRVAPSVMKKLIARGVRKELGEESLEHFSPKYNPWDQRLCLVPDSDLFNSIKEGTSSVVTDHIETFTEKGLKLKSGKELEADIIVTATGLNMKILAGLELVVDSAAVELSDKIAYKGMMYSDIPNAASAFGYTNASWTLKCDLTAQYICRLLNYMDENGYAVATPRINDESIMPEPAVDLTSGYVRRALEHLPKQGSKLPWRVNQNYIKDIRMFRYGNVDDGTMEFKAKPAKKSIKEKVASI
jgi:cation diffusion facilitator CzcD-associated flavoprotein CzcO